VPLVLLGGLIVVQQRGGRVAVPVA
jgi:hypothetical protein